MKNILYFTLTTCTIFLSCSKQSTKPAVLPTAQFDYSIQNETPPATVNFNNTSTNATTYSWDFGDNSNSTANSPTHTYLENGDYTVTLIAKNSSGQSNQFQKQISIGAKSIIIQNIIIDSCFEVSNPMSFFVTTSNSNASYQTSLYNIPFSNTTFYPAGVWDNLNYSFDLNSPITIAIFFELPGSNQIYTEAQSSFTFNPKSYITGSNAYPTKIIFIGNPGPNQTSLTITVEWK